MKKGGGRTDGGRDARLFLSILFFIFLALFPKYSPFDYRGDGEGIVYHIFQLYFFVAEQTLGIVHEGGHGVCYILPCPEPLMVANGTIFQILFPLGIAWYYKRRGEMFYALIALFFTGFSLYYTAWYISTAYKGPIVPANESFLGVDGYHDFYYLLNRMGLLAYYGFISAFVKFLSFCIMIVSVAGMLLQSIGGKE